WVSGYDSTESRDPDSLAVDHTVPLAEAWESGADRWDADRREAYANDLGYPHSLVAVTTPSLRAQGDQDPTEWKPRQDLWCDYAAWWITVKVRWRLTADQAEVDTLHSMLDSCRGGLSTTTG